MSASCRNVRKCDYGIYPLPSRFYLDQIPLDLFQLGKLSLNPKGAGFCWLTGADKVQKILKHLLNGLTLLGKGGDSPSMRRRMSKKLP